jgi:putative nucleotidyltransferase with HDIG domain
MATMTTDPRPGDRAAPARPRVCRHCGSPIAGVPFSHAGDDYCCEGCFLKQRELLAIPAWRAKVHMGLAEALAAALDARARETGLHSKRVACHTLVLARRFTGDSERLRQIYWGAMLHDIGKIGVPDAVLLKQGPLTQDEWQVMRTHPEVGRRILASASFMDEAGDIVLSHEERFDGTGYPRGLVGNAIPLSARLFAVIDTLDAMTSDRPYRKALSFDAAKAEILRSAGRQFDPQAVEAFVAEEPTLRDMVGLKCQLDPKSVDVSGRLDDLDSIHRKPGEPYVGDRHA